MDCGAVCSRCGVRRTNKVQILRLPPFQATDYAADTVKPITAERTPSVRWALASLSLSTLMPSLDTSIANVGLPTLARAFAASFQEVQWIVLAYLLAITALIVSVGRLGDITGRRRLLLAGIVLFTVASVLCGVAPTLWLLIAARAAQGLGAAIMLALTIAVVGEAVSCVLALSTRVLAHTNIPG